MYLKNYDISCLINSFPKSNSLFWYYIKQIMNVFIRAMVRIFSFGERWNVLFNSAIASLNRTFHLSPHENILTIALINIHYLYSMMRYSAIISRAVASSIIGGLIFIYLRSAQLIYFEIDCFYGLWTRIYEYQPPPPPPQLSSLLWPWFPVTHKKALEIRCTPSVK